MIFFLLKTRLSVYLQYDVSTIRGRRYLVPQSHAWMLGATVLGYEAEM